MTRPAVNEFSHRRPTFGQARPFRIALLSDPHCWRLGVWPWQLVGKRTLGYYNLVFSRRHHFKIDAFRNALRRAQDMAVDLLLITGDMTQTALPSEFALAAEVMAEFDLPTAMIPGNHDRYTWGAVWAKRFERFLGDHGGITHYPTTIHLTDRLRLICLDPCRPDAAAKGKLPRRQLELLIEELAAARAADAGVIVACHYPIVQPPEVLESRSHRLMNAGMVLRAIREFDRPVVYCSGHIHRTWIFQPPQLANCVSVNPGSCGFFTAVAPHGMGFLELIAEPEQNGRLTVRAHRQDAYGTWQAKEMVSGERLIGGHLPAIPPDLPDPLPEPVASHPAHDDMGD